MAPPPMALPSGVTLPPGMSIADLPAMMPPPGVKSNFLNPVTNTDGLLSVNWFFTSLAAFMVFVRVVARGTLKREQGYGWDDVLIVLAMFGSIAHAVLVTIALDLGYGQHMWDIRAISLTRQRLHILTSFEETYFATVFMIKISILILYKRLFGIYDTSRRLVYIGIAMVVLITIPACGMAIARSVRCDGIEALTRSLCKTQNVSTVLTIFSVCNMVTDLYTLIIPINRILKLHIDFKRKLGIFAIFVGGSAACIMSIVRLAIVISKFKSSDQIWNASKITPFTIVEMNLGIICSCTMFVPAFSKKAQSSVSPLLRSRLGGSKITIRSKGSRSEVRSTKDGFNHHVENVETGVPDLPPFQGNLSSSASRLSY